MNALFIVCSLLVIGVVNSQRVQNKEVINFLIDNCYLRRPYTTNSLRKPISQFQRENDLAVTGRIDKETQELVSKENDTRVVLQYLKAFGYIQGILTPSKITEGVKQLQKNSGVLIETGIIDDATINFVKSHPQGYSEGLFAE